MNCRYVAYPKAVQQLMSLAPGCAQVRGRPQSEHLSVSRVLFFLNQLGIQVHIYLTLDTRALVIVEIDRSGKLNKSKIEGPRCFLRTNFILNVPKNFIDRF